MSVHQIHVFVSHSWKYPWHYETLADWIFGRSWRFGQASLSLRDYSVPWTHPIVGTRGERQLRDRLHDRIRRCHVVVIPSGVYATYSGWVGMEIHGAARFGKPVLAVDPRSARRTSTIVSDAADMIVGWRARSVVHAIWELYYRGC